MREVVYQGKNLLLVRYKTYPVKSILWQIKGTQIYEELGLIRGSRACKRLAKLLSVESGNLNLKKLPFIFRAVEQRKPNLRYLKEYLYE